MKVSIIVPVYNAEKHLEKCINSILKQSFTDFELILVNDASSDSSRDICLQFINKDSRIKLLENIKNSGVAATRNHGINSAKGDYIMFCDNDDIVASNWISHLINTINENELIFPISSIAESISELGNYKNLKVGVEPYECSDFYRFYENGIAGYIWNTVFKRDILIKHNIYFESRKELGDINEDLIFVLKYISHIKYIKYTGYADYFHIMNDTNHGNITDQYFYFEKYKEKYNLWTNFIRMNKNQYSESYLQSLSTQTLYHFLHALQITKPSKIAYFQHIVCSKEMTDILKHADTTCENNKIIALLKGKHYVLLWLLFKKDNEGKK